MTFFVYPGVIFGGLLYLHSLRFLVFTPHTDIDGVSGVPGYVFRFFHFCHDMYHSMNLCCLEWNAWGWCLLGVFVCIGL